MPLQIALMEYRALKAFKTRIDEVSIQDISKEIEPAQKQEWGSLGGIARRKLAQ
jgi:hypothetical protein